MKAEWFLAGALFVAPVWGQTNPNPGAPAAQKPAAPITARDYYSELNAADEFKTYLDEYVCFYEDDGPLFLVAAKGEDVLQLMASNGEKISKDLADAKGHLFYKTYYKGVLTGGPDEMPQTKATTADSNVSYQLVLNQRNGRTAMTITYTVNWATGRIRMAVETGVFGNRDYKMRERYGKCEFIHPATSVLLDQRIPKELRENRCFQSKTAEERERWLRNLNALSPAEFDKTIKDLAVVNASDRLLGTKGCETPK